MFVESGGVEVTGGFQRNGYFLKEMFWRIFNNLINKFHDNETRCFLRNSVHDIWMIDNPLDLCISFLYEMGARNCFEIRIIHTRQISHKKGNEFGTIFLYSQVRCGIACCNCVVEGW